MEKIVFSEILRERLKGKNLSQVARDLNISNSLLSDWYSSRRVPSFKSAPALKRLADYLGLEFEELFLGVKKSRKDKLISSVAFGDEDRHYNISIRRIK
jgi:transcriptional regulator with XRE-family HTH domain